MDTNEQLRQLAVAQVLAFVALVRSLNAGAVDRAALIERLTKWAAISPFAGEILRGIAAELARPAELKPGSTEEPPTFH